ncbi:unnamed protein product [marine sediment metagenome]|uniref:Uncharacterized protein n=1 Tax=marine sediment metagenome TaxID=412755 RepID=X0RMT2_9ZZZZ
MLIPQHQIKELLVQEIRSCEKKLQQKKLERANVEHSINYWQQRLNSMLANSEWAKENI